MEETVTFRIKDNKDKIKDLFTPTLIVMSTYSFIAMRSDLPVYVSKAIYYFAWFALAVSALVIIKTIFDMF